MCKLLEIIDEASKLQVPTSRNIGHRGKTIGRKGVFAKIGLH
jgi:hypothetical protein